MRLNYISIITILFFFSCKVEEPQNPPTVVTKVASDITLKNATLNGEITDEGYSATSERGFVISDKNSNPTVSDTKVQSGYGKGIFSIVLDKLLVNTTYYFKAYATNTKGTSYGELQSFTTGDYNLASLNTDVPKNVTNNSVELAGNVTNEGGGSVIERGFCLGLNPNPTTTDNKYSVTTKGLGSFTLVIVNLKENTKYYVRSFAINEKGVVYGNEQNFKTVINPTLLNALNALKSGLQVYFPFNGNANDESGNNYNGIVNNAQLVNDRNNISKSAYSFDGRPGTNITTSFPGILGTGSRSFSFWIKRKEPIYNGTSVFAYGNQNDWGQGMSVSIGKIEQNNVIILDNYASASGPFFELTSDKWHHFVLVWDKSFGPTPTNAKFYIDGVQRPSASWTYNPIAINTIKGSNLSIGQFNVPGDQRSFLGTIDDFGIWNRALSPSEVLLLFQNQL